MRRFIDIVWVGVLAAIVAIALAQLVGLVARAIFDLPPGFEPLQAEPLAVMATIAALGAALVYGLLTMWDRVRGVQVFFWLSIVVLAVSLVGPLIIAPDDYPGLESGPIVALIIAHVSVAIPAAGLPIILGAGGAIRD